jgi:putative nucleotidyltransferase with HDIG domain
VPMFSEPLYASRKGRLIVAATLLAIPLSLFLLLRLAPRLDFLFMSLTFHIVVVSAISTCAVAVAVWSGAVAARARDASLVFLALGCLGLGLAMLGHGLTTPGVAGMPMNLWVARLPDLAIASFAVGLVAALIRPGRGFARTVARHSRLFVIVPGAAMALGLVVIVLNPEVGSGTTPLPGEELGLRVIAGAAGVALAATGALHWRRWRLGGDRVQAALMFASWMGTQALLSLHFGRFWQLSWWDYHALLLAGFGGGVYAILATHVRRKERDAGLASVFRKDALTHIERGYPEALSALVAATEAKDSYTRGHSRRVTELSVTLGQRLGLKADALRKLAWGAELHDIGKIGVPDYVLNKEGRLTPEERALVEQHPVTGWEIARQARSLRELLEVIRSHHERIDGRGYPDGLAGDAIPFAARIVAVADVWDALTSDRSYRPAWPVDRALQIMVAGRGTQFDARCLEEFLDLMQEEGIAQVAAARLIS